MSDSAIIRTRTGRPILRFRSDEKMIAEVYREANLLVHCIINSASKLGNT